MSVVEVSGLEKVYGSTKAVDGLTLSVEPGEIYALLGENGAGKSTTIEILEGHRTATAGQVRVLGADPATAGRSFRDRIGIVLQSSGVESEFTVTEVIELYRSCYRTPRGVAEVIEMVGLEEKSGERVGSLSGGQRRRLDLALGVVGRPDMLFLDEPTTGFDPVARRGAWDLIDRLAADGVTVLLTTHYLDEAERLAHRVGVLSAGRLIAEGTPSELVGRISSTTISFGLPESVTPTDALATFGALIGGDVSVAGKVVEAHVEESTAAVHALTGWAFDHGIELGDLRVARASLEDVYLALARSEASDDPPAERS